MRKLYTVVLLSIAVFFSSFVYAQPYVAYNSFISGLTAPVEVVNAGDGSNRLFIVQQNGIIRVYDPANGGLQSTPFLNVSSIITYGGERGLLSLAFHPAYELNGYFYIYYNNLSGDVTVARYHANGASNVAETNGVVLLSIPKPFDNHNGGHLQFASDSTLYFATGDGGSGNDPNNNAQNPLSRLGKMLRLKVYTDASAPYFEAPDNNPFVGNASYDSLIWALGLRNPFRWSFDRLTGDMWIGDVGQGAKEEVNYRPASSTGGENYGWRCWEGSIHTPGIATCNPPNYFPPIFDYDNPGSGSSSVVGGYVYRGAAYPALYGWYITTDVYTDSLYLIKPNGGGGWNILRQKSLVSFVVSFGEGEDGTIYSVSQGTGTIYRLSPGATLPVKLNSFTARRINSNNELSWTVESTNNISKFEVEYSSDGNQFSPLGQVAANRNNQAYTYNHATTNTSGAFYRLKITEFSGESSYSTILKLNGKEENIQVYPSIVRDGKFTINTNTKLDKVQVINYNGSVVFEKMLNISSGQVTIQLPALSKRMYVVRLIGDKSYSQKLWIE